MYAREDIKECLWISLIISQLCVTTSEKWVLSRWCKCRKVLCNNRCYHVYSAKIMRWSHDGHWLLIQIYVPHAAKTRYSLSKFVSAEVWVFIRKYISDQNEFMLFSLAALLKSKGDINMYWVSFYISQVTQTLCRVTVAEEAVPTV